MEQAVIDLLSKPISFKNQQRVGKKLQAIGVPPKKFASMIREGCRGTSELPFLQGLNNHLTPSALQLLLSTLDGAPDEPDQDWEICLYVLAAFGWGMRDLGEILVYFTSRPGC